MNHHHLAIPAEGDIQLNHIGSGGNGCGKRR
jgi:hypothetical protein